MGEIKIRGYICERCSHIWNPKNQGSHKIPIVCPKCKSPYWNIARRNKK